MMTEPASKTGKPERTRLALFALEWGMVRTQARALPLWLALNRQGLPERSRALGHGLSWRLGLRGREQPWRVLRGMSVDRYQVLSEEFVARRLLPLLSPAALRLLDFQRSEGRTPALVSSQPQAVVEALAAHLGIEHAQGQRLACHDGRLTGEVATALRIHAPQLDWMLHCPWLQDCDLEQSVAYAGHRRHAALLSCAGAACVLNPDRALARLARTAGWPVVYDHTPPARSARPHACQGTLN